MKAKIVRDGRTLRALERAGHICEPEERLRPRGKTWGAGYAYVETKATNIIHNGVSYKTVYIDGCFFPFITTP